jgi:hypothetical protein
MEPMSRETVGMRRDWFSWVFRCSALLHFTAAVFILFVLTQAANGSWLKRSVYILEHEKLVIISWISSLLSILAVIGTFAILMVTLDRNFRLILQWAWMISVIGGVALILNHLAQIFLFPALSWLLLNMPRPELAIYLEQWDSLLTPVVQVFGPSCFAISGLIYTAVMFRTRGFSLTLSWWSFCVWTVLLLGATLFRWAEWAVPFFQGLAIFMYIPWLWYVAEHVKPQFSS